MQVTVAAPQWLSSNDRKPRDEASRRGRGSSWEEWAQTREKRLAEEPPPLPRPAAQAPLPPRGGGGGGGEARDGTGRRGWGINYFVFPEDAVVHRFRSWHDSSLDVLTVIVV